MRITEVPSYEYDRIHGTSHLNTWRDGGRVLRALLVEWVNGKGTRRLRRNAPVPAQLVAAPLVPVARRERAVPLVETPTSQAG
jgi:hypothetical protein